MNKKYMDEKLKTNPPREKFPTKGELVLGSLFVAVMLLRSCAPADKSNHKPSPKPIGISLRVAKA